MFELKVINHFSAAHQLKLVAAKCENLHGHNWKIEVRVTGEKLNAAGVIIDFGQIKKYVSEIMTSLDHKFLNELEWFKGANPSSEIIAMKIARELQGKIDDPSVKVSSVTAWESEDACATYRCF
ncbi:MAG: 6-carboxytetrahydropterin synthase QueD [Proteobacteria bacterium]|nr:6-carboxytetrahydropterin synthase QueD [Pseudomonadota bacterium]MBU1712016.1 6-carboxytetrahydropterin synthase QueD [Pseudomonadota bacterium]